LRRATNQRARICNLLLLLPLPSSIPSTVLTRRRPRKTQPCSPSSTPTTPPAPSAAPPSRAAARRAAAAARSAPTEGP
ncbi:hypothetical protein TCAP_00447, partial [Tolypocladium capitatum]